MKKIIFLFLATLSVISFSQNIDSASALIIIDIQEFYFPGGDAELVNPEEASLNAEKVLEYFRKNNLTIIHVRHNYEPGGNIHKNVKPTDSEKIISKNDVNCYKDTDLLEYLKKNSVKSIVICGMQTHMCVEAAVRASHDYNFKTTLIHDACTTKDLKFDDISIKAKDVHYSTLSTLGSYAKIIDTKSFLKKQTGLIDE